MLMEFIYLYRHIVTVYKTCNETGTTKTNADEAVDVVDAVDAVDAVYAVDADEVYIFI